MLTGSAVLGAPLVTIDTQYMLNTDAQRRIPILVSSATHEHVEGLNLAVQLGDGGSANGGVNTAPRITNLDIIGPGTIFSASNTGSTPQYLGDLLALAETTHRVRRPGGQWHLAYLTVNPAGAALGSYRIGLVNVAANVSGGPWDTDFAGTAASFPPADFYIQIVSLHQSIWNAGHDGAWTDATWTNPQPPFPNYTTQAAVDTPYTVNVALAQEADSLALSGGGKVQIGSAGSLALSADSTIALGSDLQVAGILNAHNLTLGGTLSLTSGGSVHAANISGSGSVTVGNGAKPSLLTADSIQVGTLTVAAGSTVVINPLPGGPLAGDALAGLALVGSALPGGSSSGALAGNAASSVPEPSTISLLIAAVLGMFICRKRTR